VYKLHAANWPRVINYTRPTVMRPLLATCTVYTWLIGRVSTVTGTVDTRPIVEFFVVITIKCQRINGGVP
jgi:hypothetical protein